MVSLRVSPCLVGGRHEEVLPPPPWFQSSIGLSILLPHSLEAELQSLWSFCCRLELATQQQGMSQLCGSHSSPFVSGTTFGCVRQGPREVAPLALLVFTIYICNRLSESKWGSLFLYQLNLSVLATCSQLNFKSLKRIKTLFLWLKSF